MRGAQWREKEPDTWSVLVLVECVEHALLIHSQMDILKLLTLGQLHHLKQSRPI